MGAQSFGHAASMQIALPPEVSGLQHVSPQLPPAHGQLVQPTIGR